MSFSVPAAFALPPQADARTAAAGFPGGHTLPAAATKANGATGSSTISGNASSMGAEEFLKLLTVQLINQDPLEPMDDTEFIAQMTGFSTLEQMQLLNQNFSGYSNDQLTVSAQTFLGKEVTVLDASGEPVSGIVNRVRADEGRAYVTIGEREFPVSAVTAVRLPDTTATR